jgi:hypothetical protein
MTYESNLKSQEVPDVLQSEISRLQWQEDYWNLLLHQNCYNVRVTDKVLGLGTRYNYISTFPLSKCSEATHTRCQFIYQLFNHPTVI